MDNTRTMTVQIPEETYQRMKEYLRRHGVKQKDFIASLLERALDSESAGKDP